MVDKACSEKCYRAEDMPDAENEVQISKDTEIHLQLVFKMR